MRIDYGEAAGIVGVDELPWMVGDTARATFGGSCHACHVRVSISSTRTSGRIPCRDGGVEVAESVSIYLEMAASTCAHVFVSQPLLLALGEPLPAFRQVYIHFIGSAEPTTLQSQLASLCPPQTP